MDQKTSIINIITLGNILFQMNLLISKVIIGNIFTLLNGIIIFKIN